MKKINWNKWALLATVLTYVGGTVIWLINGDLLRIFLPITSLAVIFTWFMSAFCILKYKRLPQKGFALIQIILWATLLLMAVLFLTYAPDVLLLVFPLYIPVAGLEGLLWGLDIDSDYAYLFVMLFSTFMIYTASLTILRRKKQNQ